MFCHHFFMYAVYLFCLLLLMFLLRIYFLLFQYRSHCIFFILLSLFLFPIPPPPPLTHTHPAVQWFWPLQPRQLPLPAQQRGELGVSHRLPLLPHPIITLHLHLQPHPIMATPRLSFATRLPSLLHAGVHDSIIKSAELEGLFAHLSRLLIHPTWQHWFHFFFLKVPCCAISNLRMFRNINIKFVCFVRVCCLFFLVHF